MAPQTDLGEKDHLGRTSKRVGSGLSVAHPPPSPTIPPVSILHPHAAHESHLLNIISFLF